MNMKRMRGRNHRPNGGGGGGGTGGGFRNQQNGIPLNRNHIFDSSGPEMRVRGTAQQLYEKYQQMARDASSNGDRVTGESYYQHAEHYFRIISAINQAQGQPNPQQQNGQQAAQGNGQQGNNGQGNGNGYNNYGNDQYRRAEQNDANETTEPRAEMRQNEPRQNDRPTEPRQNEPRRFEQRPYEPRQKPEYPRQDRADRQDRFRDNNQRDNTPRDAVVRENSPVIDTRIDISSALDAELAATVAEPRELPTLPGFGEQPVIQRPAPVAAEARAIPIIPDAPPPATPAAEPAPRIGRPRGRPRIIKPETTTTE